MWFMLVIERKRKKEIFASMNIDDKKFQKVSLFS